MCTMTHCCVRHDSTMCYARVHERRRKGRVLKRKRKTYLQ